MRGTKIVIAGVVVSSLYYLIHSFGVYQISASSMENTLREGDWLIVRSVRLNSDRNGRTNPAFARGDVIVFRAPFSQDTNMVKRIVAVGGDRLRIYQGTLIVNGTIVNEPYVHHREDYIATSDSWPVDDWESAGLRLIVVPMGHCFVLGDNRDSSFDSRGFGPVSGNDIVGIGKFVLRKGHLASTSNPYGGPITQDFSQAR
jgi:signal peptidase I